MKRVSIAQAKNHLPKLVHEAESGRPVEIARRGKPVVVLVRRQDYPTSVAEWTWHDDAATFRRDCGGIDEWLPARDADPHGGRVPFSWK